MNQTDPEALDLCVHNVRFGFWDNLRWAGRKEKNNKKQQNDDIGGEMYTIHVCV